MSLCFGILKHTDFCLFRTLFIRQQLLEDIFEYGENRLIFSNIRVFSNLYTFFFSRCKNKETKVLLWQFLLSRKKKRKKVQVFTRLKNKKKGKKPVEFKHQTQTFWTTSEWKILSNIPWHSQHNSYLLKKNFNELLWTNYTSRLLEKQPFYVNNIFFSIEYFTNRNLFYKFFSRFFAKNNYNSFSNHISHNISLFHSFVFIIFYH